MGLLHAILCAANKQYDADGLYIVPTPHSTHTHIYWFDAFEQQFSCCRLHRKQKKNPSSFYLVIAIAMVTMALHSDRNCGSDRHTHTHTQTHTLTQNTWRQIIMEDTFCATSRQPSKYHNKTHCSINNRKAIQKHQTTMECVSVWGWGWRQYHGVSYISIPCQMSSFETRNFYQSRASFFGFSLIRWVVLFCFFRSSILFVVASLPSSFVKRFARFVMSGDALFRRFAILGKQHRCGSTRWACSSGSIKIRLHRRKSECIRNYEVEWRVAQLL